jgi:hypothetical protein
MLQHYVLIRYQKNVTEEHIAEFFRKMWALQASVEGIESMEFGRDILHDARSWDVILIMSFASVDVLRSYQQHPEHRQVMAFNQPFVADVASVDFIKES